MVKEKVSTYVHTKVLIYVKNFLVKDEFTPPPSIPLILTLSHLGTEGEGGQNPWIFQIYAVE